MQYGEFIAQNRSVRYICGHKKTESRFRNSVCSVSKCDNLSRFHCLQFQLVTICYRFIAFLD